VSALRAHRVLLGVLAGIVALASCGSGGSTTAPASGRTDLSASSAAAPAVDPCGPGTPTAVDEIGVTPDAVTVGVVADVTGPRSQFSANWDAMQAFAAMCNDRGGINGRRLDVQLFNSKVFDHRAAIEASCDSVFALVGSASVFDGDGAATEADCGIPDVPALVAEPAHANVPTVVTPFPNPQNLFLVAPQRYLETTHPAAVRKAAMAYLDVGVTALRAQRQLEATRDIGYRYPVVTSYPALATAAEVDTRTQQMAKAGVRYLSVQGRIPDLADFQRALATKQATPEVVDAGPLFYDPSYLQDAGAAAEGTWIQVLTTPLEDQPSVPELDRYRSWLARTVPGSVPTAQGMRAWSAALLFAEAARRVGPQLDRTTLLARLRGIHHWDGNGIQVPSDPGGNRASSCFAYLRVEQGAFRRAYPKKGFSCPRDGWVRLTRDFRHL
jgi:ABC-type branched-subunit amino acid transport system substrate-binding protein